MFVRAGTELVAEHPREFESEARDVLRQLELAMRETYFHPSKVPANVIGDEGRAMPQQQQQSASPLRLGVVRP
jgi:hypothetical protein